MSSTLRAVRLVAVVAAACCALTTGPLAAVAAPTTEPSRDRGPGPAPLGIPEGMGSAEADGVFPGELIDGVLDRLREADAAAKMKKVARNDGARKELVDRYWHVG